MFGFLFIYLLGAFTFWPLFGLAVLYYICFLQPDLPEAPKDSTTVQKDQKHKHATFTNYDPDEPLISKLDRESDTEAKGYIRLAPIYINKQDPYDEVDLAKSEKSVSTKASKSSIRKFVASRFFSNKNRKAIDNVVESPISSSSSAISVDSSKPKSVSKCPKYWAVIRGGQLQLFEDPTEKKILDLMILSKFVVTLWPQKLLEFELFHRRYPICLVSRFEPEGLASLDLYPLIPPRDALYIYVDNPIDKEDLYFAMIKESARPFNDVEWKNQDLGSRDPTIVAQPYLPLKMEAQQLTSNVWNNDTNLETQWLNGLLGRIFLGVKNTPVLDAYLRKKFNYKLKPISASSNIIDEIQIKSIDCGTAAPLITNVKLQELTAEGSLVVNAKISYSGGFKVILTTNVQLAAISSLTSAEIPVELAATVKSLEGNMTFRIKPPPSDRLWYAFETMPDVDLEIVPTVYDKHISLSVVTRFIKSKLLDSLRESFVIPFMDDISFYDSTDSFYKGGIWTTPKVKPEERGEEEKEEKGEKGEKEEAEKQKVEIETATVNAKQAASELVTTAVAAGAEPGPVGPAPVEPVPVGPVEPVEPVEPVATTTTTATTATAPTEPTITAPTTAPTTAPKHTPTNSIHNTLTPKLAHNRTLSSNSQISPKTVVNPDISFNSVSDEEYANDLSLLPNQGSFDLNDILNLHPSSVRRGSKSASTTQTTPVFAVSPPELDAKSHKVARKPVPTTSKLELPTFINPEPSASVSNESVGGELIESDELRVDNRRSSVGSSSIFSNNSNAPSLPPRNRRLVPLSNVAPEHL